MCVGISDGSVLDVQEIDAASNTGVEYARIIREEVLFTPAVANYRVYIIDEAHMLTSQSFNALLKIVEEPPKHAIFILATTEPHKIPATMRSRCQSFEFCRISPEVIAQRLEEVAEKEGIPLEQEAAALIARLADGALRNALSILEQCAQPGESITKEQVIEVCGLVARDTLFDLSSALSVRDSSATLVAADKAMKRSIDLVGFVAELVTHFRDMLIFKMVDSPDDLLSATPDEHEQLRKLATQWNTADILYAMRRLQRTLDAMVRTQHKRPLLELALIEIASPTVDSNSDALLRRIEQLERLLAQRDTLSEVSSPLIESSTTDESEDDRENNDPTVADDRNGIAENVGMPSSHETDVLPTEENDEQDETIDASSLPLHAQTPIEESHEFAVNESEGLRPTIEEEKSPEQYTELSGFPDFWAEFCVRYRTTTPGYAPHVTEATPSIAGDTLILTVDSQGTANILMGKAAQESMNNELEGLTSRRYSFKVVVRDRNISDQAQENVARLTERLDGIRGKPSS